MSTKKEFAAVSHAVGQHERFELDMLEFVAAA